MLGRFNIQHQKHLRYDDFRFEIYSNPGPISSYMNTIENHSKTCSGKALIGTIFILLIIAGVIWWFVNLDSELSKVVVAGAITTMGSMYISTRGKREEEQIKQRFAIYQKKTPIYEEHVKHIFEVLRLHKDNKGEINEKELSQKFMDFSRDLIV